MKVDRGKALATECEGRTAYFCSGGCRERFLTAPEQYLTQTSGTPLMNS